MKLCESDKENWSEMLPGKQKDGHTKCYQIHNKESNRIFISFSY